MIARIDEMSAVNGSHGNHNIVLHDWFFAGGEVLRHHVLMDDLPSIETMQTDVSFDLIWSHS